MTIFAKLFDFFRVVTMKSSHFMDVGNLKVRIWMFSLAIYHNESAKIPSRSAQLMRVQQQASVAPPVTAPVASFPMLSSCSIQGLTKFANYSSNHI